MPVAFDLRICFFDCANKISFVLDLVRIQGYTIQYSIYMRYDDMDK